MIKLFQLNLRGILHNNFRTALVALHHPSYANLLSGIERFGRLFKLAPVRSPNKHSEYLVGIRFVEVDKGRLPL